MGGGFSHENYGKCRHGMSMVRLIHNIASDIEVNIKLDGKIRARDVKYKDVSDYLEVHPGRHNIRIFNAKTKECITQLSTTVTICKSKTYTIIVSGLNTDLESLKLLTIVDDKTEPTEGKVMVRFVHAAAGTFEDGVDVYNRSNGDDLVFQDYKYGYASKYIEVEPGVLSLLIAPVGSLDGVGPFPVETKENKIYTIIASGLDDSEEYPVTTIETRDKAMCICLYE